MELSADLLDSSDEEEMNLKSKIYEDHVNGTEMERLNFEEDSDDNVGEDESLDKQGTAFLQYAEHGDIEEMTKLLENRPDLLLFRDCDHYTALHRAAYSEQPGALKFLLNRGADISAITLDGWSALHSACRWNSAKCVHILLQNGADINAKTVGGLTPLHIAAENAVARETLTILLLNPKLDPYVRNASGEIPETVASQHGSFAYLFELVRKSIFVH